MKSNELPPTVELSHLDHLWFQVSGTLCNLTCHHCFISCSPQNDTFGHLTFEDVKSRLEESVAWGVKEYYFTGGEPFLNREIVPMLVETLRYGPVTVLTNGTVLRDSWLEELRSAEQSSLYSLEMRVSIDGFSAATNDPIRGKGTFNLAMEGVKKLVEYGFMPIITATRTWSDNDEQAVVGQFISTLKLAGYERPRLKILPSLQLGAEMERTSGYRDSERVTPRMMKDYDTSQLVCNHSRVVTDRGVYVCPILLDSPEANLGDSFEEASHPYALRHGACYTCYQYGAICSNASSAVRGES
ncbi:MAG: radical SAM protein [Planctomycetaceae bacterium]|nr:radical SAM protein [Planctomycetaceae bacterium]